jgi:hypothetical protein
MPSCTLAPRHPPPPNTHTTTTTPHPHPRAPTRTHTRHAQTCTTRGSTTRRLAALPASASRTPRGPSRTAKGCSRRTASPLTPRSGPSSYSRTTRCARVHGWSMQAVVGARVHGWSMQAVVGARVRGWSMQAVVGGDGGGPLGRTLLAHRGCAGCGTRACWCPPPRSATVVAGTACGAPPARVQVHSTGYAWEHGAGVYFGGMIFYKTDPSDNTVKVRPGLVEAAGCGAAPAVCRRPTVQAAACCLTQSHCVTAARATMKTTPCPSPSAVLQQRARQHPRRPAVPRPAMARQRCEKQQQGLQREQRTQDTVRGRRRQLAVGGVRCALGLS